VESRAFFKALAFHGSDLIYSRLGSGRGRARPWS
jgi:hypothetical protein